MPVHGLRVPALPLRLHAKIALVDLGHLSDQRLVLHVMLGLTPQLLPALVLRVRQVLGLLCLHRCALLALLVLRRTFLQLLVSVHVLCVMQVLSPPQLALLPVLHALLAPTPP